MQLQSRGSRRSTCLDMPRNLVIGSLSYLNLLGDLAVQGSQKVDMRRPAWGSALHPDPGMPGSKDATVLDRISFRKTHS